MKIILRCLIFFLFFLSSNDIDAQKKDTLTNEIIIQLTKIGLQPSVIIMKIQNSIQVFDVSTNGLINLTNSKVASEVINEMMKSVNKQQDANAKVSNNPQDMHQAGIYYFNISDTTDPIRKIDPLPCSYQSGGGGYGGFGGYSTYAVASGGESKLKIKEKKPVFYFYFNNITYSLSDWFAANSPNEFVLVKFITKKDKRLFKVESSSSFGMGDNSTSGIPEKQKITFEYSQISEGIYKVTFKGNLAPGQYCFVFETNTKKIFDFDIVK